MIETVGRADNATLLISGLALIIGVIVGMLSMRIRPKTNQKDEGK